MARATHFVQLCCLQIPYKVEERGTENVNTSNIRPILPIVSYSSVPSVKLVRSSQICHIYCDLFCVINGAFKHIFKVKLFPVFIKHHAMKMA